MVCDGAASMYIQDETETGWVSCLGSEEGGIGRVVAIELIDQAMEALARRCRLLQYRVHCSIEGGEGER